VRLQPLGIGANAIVGPGTRTAIPR
jgi:hypothetical protein